MFSPTVRSFLTSRNVIADTLQHGARPSSSLSTRGLRPLRNQSINPAVPTLSPDFWTKPNFSSRYTGFSALYHSVFILSPAAKGILANEDHPLYHQVRKTWANRNTNALWWYVVNNADAAKKGVVRHHFQRRIRVAFCDALKRRGLDEECRPLQDGETTSNRPAALTGTLSLNMTSGMMQTTHEELCADCDKLLDTLQKRHRGNAAATTRRTGTQAGWKTRESHGDKREGGYGNSREGRKYPRDNARGFVSGEKSAPRAYNGVKIGR